MTNEIKAQQCVVVLPEWLQSYDALAERMKEAGWRDSADAQWDGAKAMIDEVARLNSYPASAGDERAARLSEILVPIREGYEQSMQACLEDDNEYMADQWREKRDEIDTALSANHSEQVLEGWQLVPVEPIDAMLEAGDKYIGTPATYKAMLSACPSPAITKDFSQFLSAVMDAAGLIRHGRQSKELSEYLGMKCMEYRGAAPSAGSHKEKE